MLVIGGSTYTGEAQDTIYEYDVEFEFFRLQEKKLAKPKMDVGAVMVDTPNVQCT